MHPPERSAAKRAAKGELPSQVRLDSTDWFAQRLDIRAGRERAGLALEGWRLAASGGRVQWLNASNASWAGPPGPRNPSAGVNAEETCYAARQV